MKKLITAQMKVGLLSFFIFFSVLGSSIARADNSLPTISLLEEEFNQTSDENARYQILNRLGDHAESIVKEGKELEYISFIKKCIQSSKDKGDAWWVYNRGEQNISLISEFKVNNFIKVDKIIIPSMAKCDNYSSFLIETGEGFQHKYLSETALQFVLTTADHTSFEDYYQCISKIKSLMHTGTPQYVLNDYDSLMSTLGLVYIMRFKELKQIELAPWLNRVQPIAMQRLLTNFNDQLVMATAEDLQMIQKIIWISKSFHQVLWEKYNRDPYNDWQYKAALQTISRSLLKIRRHNWPMAIADIEFLTKNLSPAELMGFCEELGLSVTESTMISKLIARQLLPSFGTLDFNLHEKNIETRVFPKAYSLIQTLSYTKIELEGIYKIDLKGYPNLTIVFVNDKVLAAGLRSDRDSYNMSFQQIDYDVETQTYKGQFERSSLLSVLTFKMTEAGLTGCLNFECFKGKKIFELPNYLGLAEKRKPGPDHEVTGIYKGHITLENGQVKPVSLTISFITNLVADFGLDYLHMHQSFQGGLKNHDIGIVYLSTGVNSMGAMNFIRANVEKVNGVFKLNGLWFSSHRGSIAKLSLSKTGDL